MAGVKGKSGSKKGRIVDWNVGRKATGKVRNINLNISCTAEEKELIKTFLKTKGKTLTDGILNVIKEENKLKFDSYVEDRFVLMGKRMISEYEENMNSKSPKLSKEQLEILADDIFTIQLATSLYSKSK